MAGRRPGRELRAQLPLDARKVAAAWVAARQDPAFAEREQRAALLLVGAQAQAAYRDARRTVRELFGLDPDAVPHDPPAATPPRV